MNASSGRNGLWPHGWLTAILAVPAVWVVIVLLLSITERWLSWPDPASRRIVVYCAVGLSLIPLVLSLIDLLVHGLGWGDDGSARRIEAVAEIERNRFTYQDMAWRAAQPNQPPADDPAVKRFEDLKTAAQDTTDEDTLDALVEEAEALAQRRAYLCPEAEITSEAKAHLNALVDWGVPASKLAALRDSAAPALETPLKNPAAARGALHVILEEYDAWDSYIDDYNANTWFWASVFLAIIIAVAALALFLVFGLSWRVLALFLAAGVGATASVIARLPGLTSYGEWAVNLRAYQARIGTGIVGSLVGIGLLGSGFITIPLPRGWTADTLLVACIRACPAPGCPDPADATPPAATTPGSTTPPDKPKETCDPGGLLFLIAVTMLLGFSERILTTLEGRVVGPGTSATTSTTRT